LLHAMTTLPTMPAEWEIGWTPEPALKFRIREKSLSCGESNGCYYAILRVSRILLSVLTDLQLVHVLPTVFLICTLMS
jgi:hypothetical protein